MSRPPVTTPSGPALRRELGRWDLTAIGVNQVIGGALFAQPSLYAASVGAWSPWLVAAVGLASMLIALSFAEVSSRFDGTGGPYLCTRAAFGRFAAFEVGWMLWFTRAASWAAVINVLATALGFYVPALAVRLAARRLHLGGHRHDCRHQHQGHQAEQPCPERADGREAAPAHRLRRRRDLLHRSGTACPRPDAIARATVGDGPALDFRVRRIRGHSRSGGRSARSQTRRALCPDHDDRRRHDPDDARADRRARDAAGARGVQNAARRRRCALHGRRGRGAAHARGGAVDDRQQHGAGVVGIPQPLCACRAGRSAHASSAGCTRSSGRR